ncbi:hypothetical protein [Halomonas cupida]|uniref:hypothetical protein n=1 Tax=Halomonas cupida TaxID=44933 RepID=UPI0014795180|nr:hypothetical protein [Halomonas cupida]
MHDKFFRPRLPHPSLSPAFPREGIHVASEMTLAAAVGQVRIADISPAEKASFHASHYFRVIER